MDFTSYFSKNINCLQNVGISSRTLVKCRGDMPDGIAIYKTRSDKVSIGYRSIILHSQYDPEKEAQKFVAAQKVVPGDFVLLYGLGLGYHVRELLKVVGPQGRVVVFEPNITIVNAAIIVEDFSDLLADKRFDLLIGADEELLSMHLSAFIDKEFSRVSAHQKKVVIHLPSYQCLPPNFTVIKEVFDLLLLERKASEVFSTLQRDNCRKNLDALLASPSLETIAERFRGKPALFINAGPSLDGCYRHLLPLQDRAFIFTSDTSYAFLKRAGFSVDVVFSVDPQIDTAKHFERYGEDRALLVALPSMDSTSFMRYKGPKVCVLQKGNSITSQCEELLKEKTFTYAGGSVSCIGLDLILQLGCAPVIFAGTDYSFPAFKYYSTNTAETRKWYSWVGRFNTIEMLHFDVIQKEKLKFVPDKKGRLIPTHASMYLYLKQIEALVKSRTDVRFYNFMSHGAKIEDATNIDTLAELTALLPEAFDKSFTLTQVPVDRTVQKQVMMLVGEDGPVL